MNEIINYIQKTEVIKIDKSSYMNISKKNDFMNEINEVSKVICDLKYYDSEALDKMFNSPLKLK